MNRKLFLLMLCFVMTFAVVGGALSASAAEQESLEEDALEEDAEGTVAGKSRAGWLKSGGYTYYYKANGKVTTGWKKINNKIYYFRKKADGEAPKGSMATGFCTIGKKQFYFSRQGVLQYGGWKTINKKNYYLTPRGNVGTLGAMYTGLKKINGEIFCFNEDGSACVGWTTYKGKRYFFSNGTKLGVRGRAITGWRKIGSDTYYFASNGVMQKNRWIGKYYVDKKGRLLRNGITPDGYKVDSDGKKQSLAKGWVKQNGKYYYYVSGKKTVGFKKINGKKYYFNKNGVRKDGWVTVSGSKYYLDGGVVQTGWQTIGGNKYYFKSGGKMAVNTTVDGIKIGADGIAEESNGNLSGVSVLLISGHGQGDVGAMGSYSNATYYEYNLTREFSTLIMNKLNAMNTGLQVTMYNQNYDCYQVMAGKKSGPKPNLTDYDYILEVHFNATAASSKDSKGDGAYKGIGMYVNYSSSKETNAVLGKSIVQTVASQTGFKVWGGGAGLFNASGLLNARLCKEAGVPYGLLETAFIDDRDDITFYNKNKDAMAQAVASAICSYFAQ